MMPTMVATMAGINHVVQELRGKHRLHSLSHKQCNNQQGVSNRTRFSWTHLLSFGSVWTSFCSQNQNGAHIRFSLWVKMEEWATNQSPVQRLWVYLSRVLSSVILQIYKKTAVGQMCDFGHLKLTFKAALIRYWDNLDGNDHLCDTKCNHQPEKTLNHL